MNTVDSLLKLLVVNNIITNSELSTFDKNSLTSLYKSMLSTNYITKNQGNLITRIIKENSALLQQNIFLNIDDTLTNPIFERDFRVLQPSKKLYIQRVTTNQFVEEDLPLIVASMAYFQSADLNKILQKKWKKVEVTITNSSTFSCNLTEKNVVAAVELLKKYNFEISDEITELYNTITSWNLHDVKQSLSITEIKHQNLQKHITADLGLDTGIDDLIIKDRRMRYQYTTTKEFPSSSLTEIIANRPTTKVWVDSNKYKIDEIIASLILLKRLPCLVVFGSASEKHHYNDLLALSNALDLYNIKDNIGIYFRLPNNETGKSFNELIASKNYNSNLDSNTLIAGAHLTKLPKFFLSESWTPMSVITINNSLRHSKTAVYANRCDLQISYTASEPIIETRTVWEYD